MFKAARTRIQASHLPKETRPQRGRRKRNHRRSERRGQGEVSGDDDPSSILQTSANAGVLIDP